MADIVSPLPGVFYRQPSPDAPHFVVDGADVEAGQTIGLVEIMKQFAEVTAKTAGKNIQFKVENEATVNPGDILASTDD